MTPRKVKPKQPHPSAREIVAAINRLEGDEKTVFWKWLYGRATDKVRWMMRVAAYNGKYTAAPGSPDGELWELCQEVARLTKAYVRMPTNSERDEEMAKVYDTTESLFHKGGCRPISYNQSG